MRICRYESAGGIAIGFYEESHVTPFNVAAKAYDEATGNRSSLPKSDDLLPLLRPGSRDNKQAEEISAWLDENGPLNGVLRHSQINLLLPIPRPNKLFLLAGNYAKHIEEGGGIAAERAETFPYVFMKPPSTTLTDPGKPIRIPRISAEHIDWELELAIVIGKGGKAIPESKALEHVAGYTVINDISDRQFRPNPGRSPREKDSFFDWLHGKWHDSFCPCGPCVATPGDVPDPQTLAMKLRVNGKVKQDASTSQQVFPVAAVIEFVSNIVRLEPGDIISTGTPHGVGHTTGDYLKAGDRVEATIESIGTLISTVENEADEQEDD